MSGPSEPSVRFWGRAIASLARNCRHRPFLRDWLTAGLRTDADLKAPTAWIGTVDPAIYGLPVSMGVVTYRVGTVTPFELYCLTALAQLRQPRSIFEFGTFDGATTLALARAASDADVYTIDLPGVDTPAGMAAPTELEVARRRAGAVGSAFAGTAEAARIHQLWGDSTTFDYSEYARRIDLVFVDAAHERSFVSADTANALELVSPGGMVLWHDYTTGWPGVQSVVDELVQAGDPIVRLESTSLALLRAEESPSVRVRPSSP